MKSILLVLVLAAFSLLQNPTCAQNKVPPSTPSDSCGPANLKFEVEHDNSQLPPTDPEPGKALIYVIEVSTRLPASSGFPLSASALTARGWEPIAAVPISSSLSIPASTTS